MRIKLTAFPCLCADVFTDSLKFYPGGEELNFAMHASKFGEIDVTLMGAIGKDVYGDAIEKILIDKRMDTHLIRRIPNRPTARNITYLTPDGDRYYKDDSWSGKILDEYRLGDEECDVLKNSDVVFTHYYSANFEETILLKKEFGFKLAVDFDIDRNFEKMESYAPYIDYFMISGAEEYLYIFKEFSEKYPGLFNMTLADKGSVTYENGNEFRVAAKPVKEIVDTTGCGDSYHAGFVCEHLLSGDILRAMHRGSQLAAEVLSHLGGF